MTGAVAPSMTPNGLLLGVKGVEGTGSSVGPTGSAVQNSTIPISMLDSKSTELTGTSGAASSSAKAKSEMGRMKASWLLSFVGLVLGSLLIGF